MAFLRRRRGGSRRNAELGEDQRSLLQLQAARANLGLARHVIHNLSFDDGTDARSAAAVVERAGWEVSVSAPTGEEERWAVRAEGLRVVDPTTVGAFRSWFERVAAEGRGTYEGWEAAAKP